MHSCPKADKLRSPSISLSQTQTHSSADQQGFIDWTSDACGYENAANRCNDDFPHLRVFFT